MINVRRKAIVETLKYITPDKPILLPYNEEELKELFFDEIIDDNGNKYYKLNELMMAIKAKIDFSNIPFDNVKLSGINLSYTHGIKFNPQTIYQKSLRQTTLCGSIEIIGNDYNNQIDLFDGVDIRRTKFNNAKNVVINPQTISEKYLEENNFSGVKFSGYSFDGVRIYDVDFTGSSGAKINPNKLERISYTDLTDVELLDLPEKEVNYNEVKFSSSKNYQELCEEVKKYQEKFTQLVKNQIPHQEEELPKVIEEDLPKQKRKWFKG